MKLLLCDDEKLLRISVAELMRKWKWVTEVDTAANGDEVLQKVSTSRYNVVLLDINMPGKNGAEVARVLLRDFPKVKLIILTNHSGEALMVTLFRLGVHGIILKDTDSAELENAVQTVATGIRYFTNAVQAIIDGYDESRKSLPTIQFAQRHKQVLELLLKGKSAKDIATLLNMSLHTVNSYKRDMLELTRSQSTSELLAYVAKNGIS